VSSSPAETFITLVGRAATLLPVTSGGVAGGNPGASSQALVEQTLRWNIGTGIWEPGTSIPSERELAGELGVGRATLRSAIEVLRAEGLLVTSIGRGGGTRIADHSPVAGPPLDGAETRRKILDYFEIRGAVEPEAAALAAERGTTRDFDRLREILLETATSVRSYRALDSRFHIGIAEASGNPLMLRVIAELRVEYFTWADGLWLVIDDWHGLPETHRNFALTHRSIYDSLMVRDAARAREEVRLHLLAARDSYLQVVDNGKLA
jgi:GntR family transcriptional regulator, transcriptional repressor for pyruvate dehydrogenase complex